MIQLKVAFDAGTSASKIIYQVGKGKPKFIRMLPHHKVSVFKGMTAPGKLASFAAPEDNAWIRLSSNGEIHLVGASAADVRAKVNVEALKHEVSRYKILAAIGAIARREQLGQEFTLDLLTLLPLSEYRDGDILREKVEKDLRNFYFQDQLLQVRLSDWSCLPEGAGLALLKREALGDEFQERSVAVLMFGHRNSSSLVFQRGRMVADASGSTDLGFYQCLDLVALQTSGQDRERILEAIQNERAVKRVKIPGKVIEREIEKDVASISPRLLVRAREKDNQKEELSALRRAIASALTEYWSMLSDWIGQVLPLQIDEVVVGGGAALFFESNLRNYFSNCQLDFPSAQRSDEIADFLGLSRTDKEEMAFRLADCYGAFCDFAGFWLNSNDEEVR